MLGVAVFAMSIYLYILTNTLNRFNSIFMIISLVIITLSITSWYMKKSLYTLCLYLVILFSLFIAQFIMTIALLMERDNVVEWAVANASEESGESIEELKILMHDNVRLTTFVLLVATMLTLAVFMVGWWYRQTIQLRVWEAKYKRLRDGGESEYEIELP